MKIIELLTKDTISLSINSTEKMDAIEELVSVLDSANKLNDRAEFKKAILKREETKHNRDWRGNRHSPCKNKSGKASSYCIWKVK